MTGLLDADEVRRMLAEEIGKCESRLVFAEFHCVSSTFLGDVLAGKRDPGPKVMDILGLERVVGYRKRTSSF